MIKPLDDRIVDAGALVSVLLVFVFAFFSALFPQLEELRTRPRPDAVDDRRSLQHRLRTYELISLALIVLVVAILALLAPLSIEVVRGKPWRARFDTVQIGLIAVDVLLIVTAGVVELERRLLAERRPKLS